MNNHGNVIYSHWAPFILSHTDVSHHLSLQKETSDEFKLQLGVSVSKLWGAGLHGTAVSNDDSNDDRKLLFLSWIDARFFSEMEHTSVNWQTFSTYAFCITGTYDQAAQG